MTFGGFFGWVHIYIYIFIYLYLYIHIYSVYIYKIYCVYIYYTVYIYIYTVYIYIHCIYIYTVYIYCIYIYTGWWFQPRWKILVSWHDYSQYMEKNVSSHQSVYKVYIYIHLQRRYIVILHSPSSVGYVRSAGSVPPWGAPLSDHSRHHWARVDSHFHLDRDWDGSSRIIIHGMHQRNVVNPMVNPTMTIPKITIFGGNMW